MDEHPALRVLGPDEEVQVQASVGDTLLVVTNRRMAVADAERLMLDVPIENLRRIQFDIERQRPATLVIVPERPQDEPQVLAIEPRDYEAIVRALVVVGHQFTDGAAEDTG
jgi:hypothetical protein